MSTEENPNSFRNPLLFILLIIVAAAITGGAVWFATRHQAAAPAPVVATAETPAATTETQPEDVATTEEAAPATGATFSAAQKAEIESIIKAYIMDNPDVLVESLQANVDNAQQPQTGRLEKVPAGLYDYPLTPSIGPKDAKLVVVQFFDYNCGFCKRIVPDFMRLIGEEPDVKFMFKELPILSAESEVAARYALAANKQGKYLEFHTAVMEHQGQVSQSSLEEAATEAGLDVAKMKRDADGQDVRDALRKNMELARSLGVQGTPFFVVGRERIPGAVGYMRLKDLITSERAALDKKAAVDSSVSKSDTDATTDTQGISPDEPLQDRPITD
jgi:protein-disulfide isomerase